MLERVSAFKTTDGQTFSSVGEAQRHALLLLIPDGQRGNPVNPDYLAELMVNEAAKVVDILTTTERSLPRARKVNGGTKKRTPKAQTANPET